MIFSDTGTEKAGLVQMTDFLLFGSSTENIVEYPLADKTRSMNKWYRQVMAWIFEITGTRSFDDKNYTNLPIFPANCVTGQHDYTFPTEAVDIEEIHYKDASGIWHKLIPIDRRDISGVGLLESGVIGGVSNLASEEFLKSNGTPKYYDKFANSYWLYPAPNRTSTDDDSIRVYCTRDAARTGTTSVTGGPFLTTDTTKEPGFNRLWHPVLAFGAAYEYAIANSSADKKQDLLIEIERYKFEIQNRYAKRNRDERSRLQVLTQNNK